MKFRNAWISLTVLVGILGSLWAEVVDQRNIRVPAQGIERVRFEVAAGFLDIQGSAAESFNIDAEFDVDARQSSVQEILNELVFEHRVQGSTLIVETRTDVGRRRNENARINLTVEIPAYVDLEISDGSGWIRVANVDGQLDIKDGSGALTLSQVGGDVNITDGSGGIEIRGAAGALDIRDGSGEIDIQDVGRTVQIRDGSGEIDVRGVGGDVVLSDSSGGIRVNDVDGSLEVLSDSTGGIRYDNIGGQVRVPQRRRN